MFHKSIAVRDIDETIAFYRDVLGCRVGRKAANWVDFNFFGHQLTTQLSPKNVIPMDTEWRGNRFFPVRHFGVILKKPEWIELRDKIEQSELTWLIEPSLFYEGEVNEQESFFVKDPNGYAIEFKTFGENYSRVFSKDEIKM
ncbi:MAG: extradiol dioxygenase family protein [Crocinitomicaceae bacterium]|jgi:extradiol dioxygenase family protein